MLFRYVFISFSVIAHHYSLVSMTSSNSWRGKKNLTDQAWQKNNRSSVLKRDRHVILYIRCRNAEL